VEKVPKETNHVQLTTPTNAKAPTMKTGCSRLKSQYFDKGISGMKNLNSKFGTKNMHAFLKEREKWLPTMNTLNSH
jgi:hypothetical protein